MTTARRDLSGAGVGAVSHVAGWGARSPDEVEVVDGGFWFIAQWTPDAKKRKGARPGWQGPVIETTR